MEQWLEAWPPELALERVRLGFCQHFGQAPVGVYSAPGRVNLIGEHTDYQGGACLPIALPHRSYVALAPLADDSVCLASASAPPWQSRLSQVHPGTVSGWGAYPAGVAWALTQRGLAVPGFCGWVESCVPLGAGLSSSAALTCAFALGLNDLAAEPWPDTPANRRAMVQAAVQAENQIAQAATGGLDQSIAMAGQAGQAMLLEMASGTSRQVPFDLTGNQLALLVINTRVKHHLTDGQYGQRRAETQAAARLLGVDLLAQIGIDQLPNALTRLTSPLLRRRTRHVVSETNRVYQTVTALEAGDFRQVGQLFTASHASLRDDMEVSCLQLDQAVEAAAAAGALGARMTGGGFGGSAIALVPATATAAVALAVTERFDQQGWQKPQFLLATASGPARVEPA